MGKQGKKYLESLKKVDRSKRYELEAGVKLLTETAVAKFDEGVDVAVRLGVDPKKPDQMVRRSAVPPPWDREDGPGPGFCERPQGEGGWTPGLTLWGRGPDREDHPGVARFRQGHRDP